LQEKSLTRPAASRYADSKGFHALIFIFFVAYLPDKQRIGPQNIL
jgi:hypothetical protein